MVAIGPTGPITKSATVPVPEFEPPERTRPNLEERARAEFERQIAIARSEAKGRRDAADARQRSLSRGRFRNLDLSV